jgi:hypothetical protein
LTGSLNTTGNASKTGQGKRLLKNGECSQDKRFGAGYVHSHAP